MKWIYKILVSRSCHSLVVLQYIFVVYKPYRTGGMVSKQMEEINHVYVSVTDED